MIESFRTQLGKGKLVDLVRGLLAKVGYRDELERCYKSPSEVEARWQSVEELVNAVAQYEANSSKPTLLGFLEEVALANREDQREEDPDTRVEHAVSLMTLHSAKGLEFPHVFMVGMEEGLIPHKRSVVESRGIDEERRLCYVGVTRARESLTLTLCKARMKWGKLVPSIPSRFLMEMRGETDKARRAAEAAVELYQESERAAARAERAKGGRSSKTVTGKKGGGRAPARAGARRNAASDRRPAGRS
jgi:DNA helicase-2/ATP-dependent DNA helicase PcrA